MISSVDTGTKRAILVIHTFYYPLIVKGLLSINCIFKGNANVCPHFLPTVLVFLNTPTANLRYMKKFLPTLHVIELALGGLVTNGKEHN